MRHSQAQAWPALARTQCLARFFTPYTTHSTRTHMHMHSSQKISLMIIFSARPSIHSHQQPRAHRFAGVSRNLCVERTGQACFPGRPSGGGGAQRSLDRVGRVEFGTERSPRGACVAICVCVCMHLWVRVFMYQCVIVHLCL